MPANIHLNRLPENKHQEYMKPRRRSSISGPIIFFLTIVGILFIMSVFFRVSVINVIGNQHYSDEEIINAIDIEEGDNLFFFDRFAAISRVFAKLPYIEEVTVKRYLPNRVEIHVTESRALAYLKIGDELWTMDRNCKILGKAASGEDADMIPVTGINPGTLLIGETMTIANGDQNIIVYLSQILDQIQERQLERNVNEIDFSDVVAVKMQFNNRYTVNLGRSENVEYKFGMLLSAVSQLSAGDVGVIDVSDSATAHFSPN